MDDMLIKWGAITVIAVAICITVAVCIKPMPTDALAQRLRMASTVDVQEQIIKAYYADTLKAQK
jgi:hypothetical protein